MLVPGDIVMIPDMVLREEIVVTGKRHAIKRCGVPERLRIVLRDCDEPRPNFSYVITIDGARIEGVTDAR